MRTNFNLIQSLRSWFFGRDGDITMQTGRKIVVDGANIQITNGDIVVVSGTVTIDGSEVSVAGHAHTHASTTGQTANDHHNEAHTIASHSDTTGTGSELNTLTDGSNADALHAHAVGSHTIASHSDTTGTGSELNTLTDGSNADALHAHTSPSHTIASHSDTSATGTELNTLTDGSDAGSLHIHDGRYFQESEFSQDPGASSKPLLTTSNGYLTLRGLAVGTGSPAADDLDVSGDADIDGRLHVGTNIRTSGGIVLGNLTHSIGAGLLVMKESASPSTPTSGYGIMWVSTSGDLWFKNDSGTATNLTP